MITKIKSALIGFWSTFIRSIKGIIFEFYWLIVGVCISTVLINRDLNTDPDIDLGASFELKIIGLLLAGAYFIQRQKLSEAEFFLKAYAQFNERYDNLNDELQIIIATESVNAFNKKRLIDYFNLCAEEYLLFRQGYIPMSVWRSWEKGMAQYFSIPEVQKIWHIEKQSQSYYDFDPDVMGLFESKNLNLPEKLEAL